MTKVVFRKFKDGEVIVSYSGSQAYYGDTGMEEEEAQVRDEILNLDVNNLTPLEALNKLNDIKRIVKG